MSSVQLRVASVRIDRLPPDLQSQVLAFLRGEELPARKATRKAARTSRKADVLLEAEADAEGLYRPEPLPLAA